MIDANLPENSTTKTTHVLDELFLDVCIYQSPELLLEEPRKLIEKIETNQKKLQQYERLLSNIRFSLEKVKKYEKYFADFYPHNETIDQIEALNHHIHSYLQDVYILREKISNLLNQLRNDCLAIAPNKEEVRSFYDAASHKLRETFSSITEPRRLHTHKGSRFIDTDLTKAENALRFAQLIQSPQVSSFTNQAAVPKLLQKLQADVKTGFENSKNKWINITEVNNTQTTEFLNAILHIIESNFYQALKIIPSKTLFSKLHSHTESRTDPES